MEVVFNVKVQDNAHTVIKMGGVSEWWPWEGDTGISTEHFLYNENNLTKCSTQRNSPPIPHTPPPLLHHHYITISKPRVQSKSSLSRIGARHSKGGGRGQDWGSKSRPKTELAFIPVQCVRMCTRQSEYGEHANTSACLLVRKYYRKSVEILGTTDRVFHKLHWREVNSHSRGT